MLMTSNSYQDEGRSADLQGMCEIVQDAAKECCSNVECMTCSRQAQARPAWILQSHHL